MDYSMRGNMLKQAKITLKSLIYDDSGVAMAYTIMVFLFFFMLCVSTYAMTENIRQKIELQNACDAAAYSGAVVQADMLSRIAVLNRALSWTYAETNKRHMDYIVDQWLRNISGKFRDEEKNAREYYERGACKVFNSSNGSPCGHSYCGIRWRVGYSDRPKMIRLNKNGNNIVSVDDIESAYRSAPPNFLDAIKNGYDNITVINEEIKWIQEHINEFVSKTVAYTMSSNASGIKFKCLIDGSWDSRTAATYIDSQTNEEKFLNYSANTCDESLNNGCDIWWLLDSSKGFRRFYSKSANALIAELGTKYTSQHWHDNNGVCHAAPTSQSIDNIFGTECYESLPACPVQLNSSFFGRAGTIVVTAKRPLDNPFTVIFRSDAKEGLYGAFNGNNTDMWAISTARAGVRFNNDPTGYYRVHYPGETAAAAHGYTNGVWNLCEDDWDAVMIPVSRAWNETSSSGWSGNRSSQELLSQVKEKLEVKNNYSNGIDDNNGGITGGFMRH